MRLIGAHVIGEQAIELIDIDFLATQTNANFQGVYRYLLQFPEPRRAVQVRDLRRHKATAGPGAVTLSPSRRRSGSSTVAAGTTQETTPTRAAPPR
jgi:hypothetical protein